MNLSIGMILSFYIIFCNEDNFINAKPIIGQNVRLARDNEFPHVVALIRVNNPHSQHLVEIDQVCTGTLITRQDVLTAAHCLISDIPDNIKIAIGSNDLRTARRHNVITWTTFLLWASQNHIELEFEINDIASIKMRESMPNDFIPLKISKLSNKKLYKKKAAIAGWSRFNDTSLNLNMLTANVKVLSNRECEKRLNKLEPGLEVDKKHALCSAAKRFALTGYGDSGGPLMYRDTIIGVNTGTCPNTVPHGHPKSVNFHMSIKFYRNFILSVID